MHQAVQLAQKSTKKSGVSTPRWSKILDSYHHIRELVLNTPRLMAETTLQLFELNQRTLNGRSCTLFGNAHVPPGKPSNTQGTSQSLQKNAIMRLHISMHNQPKSAYLCGVGSGSTRFIFLYFIYSFLQKLFHIPFVKLQNLFDSSMFCKFEPCVYQSLK